MPSLKDKIIKGTLWTFAGRIGIKLLGFFVGIIMARLLLPSDFGYVITISTVTGVAGFFASGGMGNALIRSKTLKDNDYSSVFIAQFGICSIFYLCFYSIAPYFANWFNDPIYEALLRVGALSFFIRPFKNVATSKITREMRFKALATINVCTSTISSAAGILLAICNYGPWSLILSGLIGGVIGAPLTMIIAGWFPHLHMDFKRLRTLAKTGLKFSANDLVEYFRLQSANIFISQTLGPATTGLYNRAHSLSQMPVQLTSGSSSQALFRALSKTRSDSESKELFLAAVRLLALYSTPVYVGIWWLAEPFIVVLYGEKWRFSANVLEILAVGGLYTIGPACGAAISARGKLGKALLIRLEALAVLLISLFVGVSFGVIAIAFIFVACKLYLNLRMLSLVCKTLEISLPEMLRAFYPAYLVSIILFASFLLSDYTQSITLDITSDATYLLTMSAGASILTLLFIATTKQQTIQNEKLRWLNWAKAILTSSTNFTSRGA